MCVKVELELVLYQSIHQHERFYTLIRKQVAAQTKTIRLTTTKIANRDRSLCEKNHYYILKSQTI